MAPAPAAVAPVVPAAPAAAKPVVPAAVPSAAKPAVQAERTLKLIIDGQERILTETQAITQLQKMGAVDKRLNEASLEKKKAAELLKAFEEDPEAALAKMGKDPAKIINDYLEKKAKLALLSPEQQEKAKLEAELAKLKKQAAEVEKEKVTKQQQAVDEQTSKVLEGRLVAAAKKNNLDANWETLEEMTSVAMEAIELGIADITPDQIAQEVIRRQKDQIEAREKKILAKLTPAQLIEYVGKDRFKEMLKESLKSIPGASKPAAKVVEAIKPANGKVLRPNEFRELVRKGKI